MTRQADGDPASGRLPRLLSALFYGTCSFLIVLVNKALLTTYGFPSPIVLGIGQMAATIMILYVSKLNKIIHFPDFDKKIPIKLFPLPLLYVGNHISGLSSTSKLSLPMFTVLRKFTIPLTLLLETIILGKQYPLSIIISVFAIVLGAFIAAGSDLAFSLEGYVFVFLNDIFTAANGVYTKQKMDPQELGKYGVLFYNACFMILPTLVLSASTGDLRQATEFNQWKNVLFIIQFLLSCFLGTGMAHCFSAVVETTEPLRVSFGSRQLAPGSAVPPLRSPLREHPPRSPRPRTLSLLLTVTALTFAFQTSPTTEPLFQVESKF
ncbi:UDP-N-acetylglucosamine/UDP-glucose/GDP-mannose transporter isoform X3 [Pipistrellus kuhlii]|uniref:UDP-N-acetylglucosamine/UDP-glucose/GDP-mannose transporter isoform X3 n=1 Tax=Pipistrellus kuhlii TaxID=59472 RepID=UPI001E26F6FE|nr:UDP-N-acetylglucosamine/UDP-glucose/GDP-mannose transporter isoform X3 [Pipistrellus kuhlii]